LQQCPSLGKVPSINHDLTIKATQTGITLLTQQRFKVRYTGNKRSCIDINGKLHVSSAEFAKQLKIERIERQGNKKNGSRRNGSRQNNFCIAGQISEDNTEQPKKNRIKFSYSVNKKEVRQRILGYINTQKGRKELYFWTVSFPAGTSDESGYSAFNTWLTALRYYKLLKDYLWVAERQQNGTIHFHIAIPHKMPVQRANAMMRGTLKNMAKAGKVPYSQYSPQIAKYNGVDIAKNRKTKRVTNFAIKKGSRALATYLTKYVTKNDTEFTHLAWHNSRGFSALFTAVTFTIEEFKKAGFGPFLNRVRVFEMRFAKFIPWLMGPPPALERHLYELNSYLQYVTDRTQSAN
jgi:hypothetical protein